MEVTLDENWQHEFTGYNMSFLGLDSILASQFLSPLPLHSPLHYIMIQDDQGGQDVPFPPIRGTGIDQYRCTN